MIPSKRFTDASALNLCSERRKSSATLDLRENSQFGKTQLISFEGLAGKRIGRAISRVEYSNGNRVYIFTYNIAFEEKQGKS